jgi:hypothetical protein
MVHPMLEKVARVLAKCGGENHDDIAFGSPAWHMFVDDARAAVRALMEPTEDMFEAAEQIDRWDQYSWPTPYQAWPVMLKVVLGEERARDRIDV